MKFTIEPGAFIKMIEMVWEKGLNSKGTEAEVHLLAFQERVCVEHGGTVAEMDAVIMEDGQCSLSGQRLLQVLKKHRDEAELTIEANPHGLRLAGACLPVHCYSPSALAPAAYQIFFANELGLISRGAGTATCHGI